MNDEVLRNKKVMVTICREDGSLLHSCVAVNSRNEKERLSRNPYYRNLDELEDEHGES